MAATGKVMSVTAPAKPSTEVTARSEFDGSIKIFSVLIGVSLLVKVFAQLAQGKRPELDPSVPTTDNPTGTNTSKINGQADTIIATHGWCLFWTICLWVTVISVLTRRFVSEKLKNPSEANLFFFSIPFVLVIALITWTIIQTYTFRKKINTNQVPTSFVGFSVGSTFILGLTIGLLFHISKTLLLCDSKDMSLMILTAWVAIMCSILTTGMITWTEVLLTSFTTDG
jgi:hypothetical protein